MPGHSLVISKVNGKTVAIMLVLPHCPDIILPPSYKQEKNFHYTKCSYIALGCIFHFHYTLQYELKSLCCAI